MTGAPEKYAANGGTGAPCSQCAHSRCPAHRYRRLILERGVGAHQPQRQHRLHRQHQQQRPPAAPTAAAAPARPAPAPGRGRGVSAPPDVSAAGRSPPVSPPPAGHVGIGIPPACRALPWWPTSPAAASAESKGDVRRRAGPRQPPPPGAYQRKLSDSPQPTRGGRAHATGGNPATRRTASQLQAPPKDAIPPNPPNTPTPRPHHHPSPKPTTTPHYPHTPAQPPSHHPHHTPQPTLALHITTLMKPG